MKIIKLKWVVGTLETSHLLPIFHVDEGIDDTFGDDNTAYLAGNSITSRAYFDNVCYLPVIKYLIV